MLRFICPALLSPAKMGFMESTLPPKRSLTQDTVTHYRITAGQQKGPSLEVTRHLVAVAKLLQSLANTSMQATILTVAPPFP